MDQGLFQQFRDIIYQESGIALSKEKLPLLENRISRRLRALGLFSEAEYLRILEADTSGGELVNLIDVVSTNVTHFFREAEHFHVLAEIFRRYNKSPIDKVRLWCAAASSGEEPYTLAITAKEHLDTARIDFKILATDISTIVLQKAAAGRYLGKQLEKTPPEVKKKYFHRVSLENGDLYDIDPSLKEMILFRRFNLIDFPYPLKKPLDIIFCRNVMIYFDLPTRNRVVGEFCRMLNPGGYLFLSRSENLLGVEHSLETVDTSVYQKL